MNGVICQAKEFRLHPETTKEPPGFLYPGSYIFTCLIWEELWQQSEGSVEGEEAFRVSLVAQASDDEGWTKARIMVIEKGQNQETFNRSLAWATGCLVEKWLLRGGGRAAENNDLCFGHIVFKGSGHHQGGVCHQLVNCSLEFREGQGPSPRAQCSSHSALLSRLSSCQPHSCLPYSLWFQHDWLLSFFSPKLPGGKDLHCFASAVSSEPSPVPGT